MYGRWETMGLRTIGGIGNSGGSLLLFVVVWEDAGRKGKDRCFPLCCVIFCGNGTSRKIHLDSRKGLYTVSLT